MSPTYCRQKLAERGLDVSRMSDAAVVMHYTGKQYYPGQEGESRQVERQEQELLPAEVSALFRMPGFVRAIYRLIRKAAEADDFAPSFEVLSTEVNVSEYKVERAIIMLSRANIIRRRPDLAKKRNGACYELPLAGLMTHGKTSNDEPPGERLVRLLHDHLESGEPLPPTEQIARLCGYASNDSAKRALASFKGKGFIDLEIVGKGASTTRYVRRVGREGMAA